MELEEKKEVMVAIKDGELSAAEEEETSSERLEGALREMVPKRRPSMSPEEVDMRWRREESVGPGMCTSLISRDSIVIILSTSDVAHSFSLALSVPRLNYDSLGPISPPMFLPLVWVCFTKIYEFGYF